MLHFSFSVERKGETKKSTHGSLFPRGTNKPAETIIRKEYVDLTAPRGPIVQKKQHSQSINSSKA